MAIELVEILLKEKDDSLRAALAEEAALRLVLKAHNDRQDRDAIQLSALRAENEKLKAQRDDFELQELRAFESGREVFRVESVNLKEENEKLRKALEDIATGFGRFQFEEMAAVRDHCEKALNSKEKV